MASFLSIANLCGYLLCRRSTENNEECERPETRSHNNEQEDKAGTDRPTNKLKKKGEGQQGTMSTIFVLSLLFF